MRSIEIAGELQDVWTLVWAPEFLPLIYDDIAEGFSVPGTPRGEIGERQCLVLKACGEQVRTVTVEVIEFETGRRIVWRRVPFNGSTTVASMSTQGGRTRLEVEHRYKPPFETAETFRSWRTSVVEDFTNDLDRYLPRVRDLIEGGWHPDADKGTPSQ